MTRGLSGELEAAVLRATRFCRDCGHVDMRHGTGGEKPRCGRPRRPDPDLVTGAPRQTIFLAEAERQGTGAEFCGSIARFFVAKPGLYELPGPGYNALSLAERLAVGLLLFARHSSVPETYLRTDRHLLLAQKTLKPLGDVAALVDRVEAELEDRGP